MSEEKPSMIKRVFGFWKKEIAPHTKRAYDELGEAAKDMKPHIDGATKKVKDYAGKVQKQVKGGVQDAKDVASELKSKAGDKFKKEEQKDESEDKPE